MINPDYFGFYQAGDFRFYSKLEAIEFHKKTNLHPHWNFNEIAYSCCDWTVEPVESLSELYKRRAEQIRNRYDYIVLAYSGGADSDQVLHSFIDNNIHIDEILSFGNYDATKEKINFFNAEIFEVAIPKIEKLQEQFPTIKHRVVNLAQHIVDYFALNPNSVDWVYTMNAMFNPNRTSNQDLKTSVNDYRKIIDSGKKIGFVWGSDKPRVFHINGQYVFRFIDILDNTVSPRNQNLNREWDHDELFYWSPEMPEIVIKQAHVIKNYLASTGTDAPYITKNKSDLAYKEVNGKRYWLSVDGVHKLIYPTWKPTLYQMKPSSTIFSERDEWFFKLPDSDPAKQAWKIGLKHLWKTLPDYWKNDPMDLKKGIKQCWSRDYYLE
jgi:hypothetical protein